MSTPPHPAFQVHTRLVHAALHAMGEGITLAGPTGRILYSNAAADRILGTTASNEHPESWAHHYGVFVPGTDVPFPAEEYPLVRALAGEETQDVEMFIRNEARPNGALIAVTGRPVWDVDGELIGAVVVFRDITGLRDKESRLVQAVKKLEGLHAQKQELTGFLVHDMKNPLTTILGFAELLLIDAALDEEQRMGVFEIQDAAKNLHRLVLDLLDIHAGEDGHLDPDIQAVPVQGLLQRVAHAASGVGMSLMVSSSGRGQIWADPQLLRRVLSNLVDNCLKYGPSDGKVWVEVHVDGDGSAQMSVRDEGPGVPPDLREYIFAPYARIERDVPLRHAGSRGIGLRFCKVAVEAHGGRIWVEDNEPSGAHFRIELPSLEPETPSAA